MSINEHAQVIRQYKTTSSFRKITWESRLFIPNEDSSADRCIADGIKDLLGSLSLGTRLCERRSFVLIFSLSTFFKPLTGCAFMCSWSTVGEVSCFCLTSSSSSSPLMVLSSVCDLPNPCFGSPDVGPDRNGYWAEGNK